MFYIIYVYALLHLVTCTIYLNDDLHRYDDRVFKKQIILKVHGKR